MRLLIAGWQGQLARAFLETAPGRSDVTALALGRPALDICSVRAIERALSENRPDILINTAGYTAVDDAEAEPARAMALNRDGARLLAGLAAERGVPVIHMSTANIFDGRKPAPYVEDDPAAPLSVYGASKLAGEADVRQVNPRHVILRTSWIISPYPRNFLSDILDKARRGQPLRVVSDQSGSPTYARDLANAIFDIAARANVARTDAGSSLWGTYHIANTGGPATWHDVAAQACRAAGLAKAAAAIEAICTDQYPTPAPRPANAALDTARLARICGISLRDWREAVADAAAQTSH